MSLDVYGKNKPIARPARERFPPALIIAPLASLSVAFMSSFVDLGMLGQANAASSTDTVQANPIQELPRLGNTPEGDRLMLREISDQHVFSSDQILVTDTARPIERPLTRPGPASRKTIPSQNPIPNHDNSAAANVDVIQEAARQPEFSGVWQLVRKSTRLEIPDNDQVTDYRTQYLQEALWVSKILNRANPFVGHIVEELDKRYLPIELALLPAIESGYRPDVHSAENAAGIWQIIPATAKEIGLQRTQWFDGRADLVASTTAAIDYLSYLNAEFHGDWLLTLAAYNAGLGRVKKAMKRNAKQNLPTDFWSLKLPKETQNYVPKFLALVAMLRYDEDPQFKIPDIKQGNAFETVDVGQRVSLDKAAEFSGIRETNLRLLNASLVHSITPPQGPHKLNVPLGQGDALIEGLSKAGVNRAYSLPATHTVIAGDTLSGIARLYGISQTRLLEMNALDSSLIKIGQELAIRYNSNGTDTIEYIVTIGDTLSEIAERFAVGIAAIKNEKGEELASDIIHPGVRLTIVLNSLETG
ncbi:MAG: transglycosylase SLT domain-containing protein [Granulosicoccus sp.]